MNYSLVKDSVGVSHGVMHYLHTLSSPTLSTGYAAVTCYKMVVGSFSSLASNYFEHLEIWVTISESLKVQETLGTGDRYNSVASTCHYNSMSVSSSGSTGSVTEPSLSEPHTDEMHVHGPMHVY